MATQERQLASGADRAKRPARIPVSGNRDVLTISRKDPAFEYRIVKDKPGRVDKFLVGGYEIVTNETQVGDKRVGVPAQEGSPVKISLGGGEQGYLMRIPKEWYDEDQKAKQDALDAQESAMKRQHRSDGLTGTTDISIGSTK